MMDRMDRIQKLYERVGNCHAFADYWFAPRFVCWDAQKIPYTPSVNGGTLQRASSTNPDTWGDMTAAIATLFRHPDQLMGIGLVLNGDGLVCIDLDKCVGDDGTISPEAQRVLGIFANTYAEYSPSGRGIHIWLRTSNPLPADGKRTDGIEIYQSKRYITITGNKLPNHPDQIADCTEQLHELYAELFPEPIPDSPPTPVDNNTEQPANLFPNRNHRNLSEVPDVELINQFLADPENEQLWRGQRLSQHPSDSEADCALAYRLLWLVDGDTARAERLFCLSPRASREKLQRRPDLIDRAINAAHEHYQNIQQRLCTVYFGNTSDGEWSIAHPLLCNHTFGSELYSTAVCIRVIGDFAKFDPANGEWWCYDSVGGIWVCDKSNSRIHNLIVNTLEHHYQLVALQHPRQSKQSLAMRERYTKIENVGKVRRMLEAQSELWITPDVFDQHEYLIPLQNGVWDVARGELLPHSPDYYFTRTCEFSYNPQSTGTHWEHALDNWCWDDEMNMPDQSMREYLLTALGYTLTGSVREEKLFILYGPGANGKSTLLTIIQRLMRNYGTLLLQDVLSVDKNSTREQARLLAPLKNKRFAIHPELGEETQLDRERIKTIVSYESVPVRELYREVELVKPTWKIWVCTNHIPQLPDQALWRRVVVIPFLSVFDETIATLFRREKPDRDLLKKLESELDYIGTQLCHYATKWYHNGLPECPTVNQFTTESRAESDPFERWFETCVIASPNDVVGNKDCYEHYVRFVREEQEKPLSQKAWGLRMNAKNVKIERRRTGTDNSRQRYRVGIRLVDN